MFDLYALIQMRDVHINVKRLVDWSPVDGRFFANDAGYMNMHSAKSRIQLVLSKCNRRTFK